MTTRRPLVFVGSTWEARETAKAVRENLAGDADILLWTEAFRAGESFLSALERNAARCDFAVVVWTPDDTTMSRDQESASPRDNVVFELGLFIGKIGAERGYCVHPERTGMKMPSDLLGITTVSYRPDHPNGLTSALGPACDKIRQRIRELGSRVGDSASTFCSRIAGFWWEYITPEIVSSIGFLEITVDASGGLRINGDAYRSDGSRAADWWTEGCAVNPLERKLLYVWKGRYIDNPKRPFEGFGDFLFNDSDGQFLRGHGFFAEMDVTDLRKTQKRAGKIYRCSLAEVEVMRSGNRDKINSLIQGKLAVK